MGSRICPLVWQNCSMMAGDSRAARVTMSYAFFTAVGSFRIRVWQPDSIESAPTAAHQPSTKLGTPSVRLAVGAIGPAPCLSVYRKFYIAALWFSVEKWFA